MPNTRGQLHGGKVVLPSSRSFRRMDEAADVHATDKQTLLAPVQPVRPRDGWPGNVMRVQWHALNVLQGEIYALGEPVVERTRSLQYNAVVKTAAPTAGQPFVVALVPGNEPRYGLVMDRGVALANVDVQSTSHVWADCETSNTNGLVSAGTGVAKILWKETPSTGMQKCLIQWPVSSGASAKHVDATWAATCALNGSTFVTYDFSSSTPTTAIDTDLVTRSGNTFEVKKPAIVQCFVEGDRLQNGAIASIEHGFQIVDDDGGTIGPTYAVICDSKGLAFTTGPATVPTPWTGAMNWTWSGTYYLDPDTYHFQSSVRAYVGTSGGTYTDPDLDDATDLTVVFTECDTET